MIDIIREINGYLWVKIPDSYYLIKYEKKRIKLSDGKLHDILVRVRK